MSSHHIVREKQEPALVLISLDSFDDELLGQLLEWSPTVIATSQTAEQLDAFGIKVDVVIGGSGDNTVQSDVRHIPADSDALSSALGYLVSEGYPSVNLVTGEFDQQQILPFVHKMDIVAYTGDEKIFAVRSGFSKWKPAGDIIRVISPINNLQVRGLSSAGEDIFRTDADGFYSLTFSQEVIFIAEQIS